MTIFYSDVGPLSKYSPVMLHFLLLLEFVMKILPIDSHTYYATYATSKKSYLGMVQFVYEMYSKSLTKTLYNMAVYKSGTGTRGRGHQDTCVGTWDLGTRDKGLEDIKYGTRGHVGRGRGDVKYRDAGDAGCE